MNRPANVDELLDNVGDLMDVLHEIVDMNRKVMTRTWELAEKLDIELPETSVVADEQAEEVHRMLYLWEDQNTGTSHLPGQSPYPDDDD